MEIVYSFESIIYIAIPIITSLLVLLINSTKIIKQKSICTSCMKKITDGASKCPYCQSDIIIDENYNKLQETNKIKKLNNIKSVILLIVGILYFYSATYIFNYPYNDGILAEKWQRYAMIGLTICIVTMIIFVIKNLALKQKNSLNWLIIIGTLIGIVYDIGILNSYIEQCAYEHNNNIFWIIYDNKFTVPEAKIILNQIYDIFEGDESNIEVYSIRKEDKMYTYGMNISISSELLDDSNASIYFYIEMKNTKITRIYYQWNDNVEIEVFNLYEGGKVDNFIYHINCLSFEQEPPYHIKGRFEEEIKERLKSPSSAIFTYESRRYSEREKRYYYYGYVESQNEYGAMIKRNFYLKILPKQVEYYWQIYQTDYTYEW